MAAGGGGVRRSSAIVLVAVVSGLSSVLLAVAVNVATGASLPGPLAGLSWLAWPMVAAFAVAAIVLAVWQQRLDASPAVLPPPAASTPPGC